MEADKAIKERKTQKVLANTPWKITMEQGELRNTVNELLALAASAPFHYICHPTHNSKKELNSLLPWRFNILDSNNCRQLLKHIEKENIEAGKIANMLGTADALILVNWLPDPQKDDNTNIFDGNLKNMEHIAGCSAAIQNVLIGATARQIPNYWSSGGVLRNEEFTNHLNIPNNEIMLGALFLFPKDSSKRDCTIKGGSLRNKGKEIDTWSKWLAIK